MTDKYSELHREVLRYSTKNGYPIDRFQPVQCQCGRDDLLLDSDDECGAAVVTCPSCHSETDIQDSRDYAENLVRNICTCEEETLLLGVGTAAYDDDSGDVRWVYVGGQCEACGLAGVYVDWHER